MKKNRLIQNLVMWLALVAVVLLFGQFENLPDGNEGDPGSPPPNVIFIIADDLNDALGFMDGHPQSYTPNIDKLARMGVTFSNAYANCPLCNPSRASLWTGIAPWNSNLYGNSPHWRKNELLHDAVTMQEHFKANGYEIYGTGKAFHEYSYDNLEGTWTDYGNRIGFYPTPNNGGDDEHWYTRCGHPSMPPPLDKDMWLSCGPLSDVPDVPPDPEKGTPGYKGWTMRGKPFRYVDENDRDLMPDELSAQYISELLQTDHEKPFFAVCGFFRPHMPMYAPKKYFDMFPLDELMLPVTLKNDMEDIPEILWNDPGAYMSETKYFRFLRVMDAGGTQTWKQLVQAYLSCCAFVDDQVGKILDALESSKYADNTIIIFTSDHGYNIGEKETIFKYTLWEESARVPLIISTPGMSEITGKCQIPVSLLDLYPTLIDLCNLPNSPNAERSKSFLDGYSLNSLLTDPEGGLWMGPPVATTVIADSDPTAPLKEQHISVRSKRWRYTLCSNGEEELYDHLYDPNEWTNLASKGEYGKIKYQHKKYILQLLQHQTVSE